MLAFAPGVLIAPLDETARPFYLPGNQNDFYANTIGREIGLQAKGRRVSEFGSDYECHSASIAEKKRGGMLTAAIAMKTPRNKPARNASLASAEKKLRPVPASDAILRQFYIDNTTPLERLCDELYAAKRLRSKAKNSFLRAQKKADQLLPGYDAADEKVGKIERALFAARLRKSRDELLAKWDEIFQKYVGDFLIWLSIFATAAALGYGYFFRILGY